MVLLLLLSVLKASVGLLGECGCACRFHGSALSDQLCWPLHRWHLFIWVHPKPALWWMMPLSLVKALPPEEGGTPLIGSIEGTQRITIPVIFGVLTTICTFLPMLQGVGSSGQIGAVIATVVICCLIFSLIESQLILPAHLGNKQTKTAKGEVYLLLVPLMVIVLLQFSWSTSSFVGLAIALMTVVYALDRLGLTDDPLNDSLRLNPLFGER